LLLMHQTYESILPPQHEDEQAARQQKTHDERDHRVSTALD
jgi:hypothetical protein